MALAPEKLRTVSVWPVPYGVWLDQQRFALENLKPMGRVLTRLSLGGVDDSCTGTPHCTPWPAALLCLVTTDNLLPSQGLDASLIHSLTHWTLQIIHRAPMKSRSFKTRLILCHDVLSKENLLMENKSKKINRNFLNRIDNMMKYRCRKWLNRKNTCRKSLLQKGKFAEQKFIQKAKF